MSFSIDSATLSSNFAIDSSRNIQFMYAQLQMKMVSAMDTKATALMTAITDTQAKQTEVANMIAVARNLQQQVTDTNRVYMTEELKQYCDKNKISYNNDGTAEAWTYTLKSLTNYQDTLGTDTQTKMVELQEYISLYNSYLQGASEQVSNCVETLSTILRNI